MIRNILHSQHTTTDVRFSTFILRAYRNTAQINAEFCIVKSVLKRHRIPVIQRDGTRINLDRIINIIDTVYILDRRSLFQALILIVK